MQQITGTLTSLAIYLAWWPWVPFWLPPRTPFPSPALAGPVSNRRPAFAHRDPGSRAGRQRGDHRLPWRHWPERLCHYRYLYGGQYAGCPRPAPVHPQAGQAGRPAGSAQSQEQQGEKVKVDHTLTLIIVVAVVLGMAVGHFILPDAWSLTAARSSSWACTCCCFWWAWIWAARRACWKTSVRPVWGSCWCR